ncbi:MAG: hypothetical protein K1X91_08505 [Bacteriodetes bacterium]|nr:hypothetical protein [Bacteroidota bacterium]
MRSDLIILLAMFSATFIHAQKTDSLKRFELGVIGGLQYGSNFGTLKFPRPSSEIKIYQSDILFSAMSTYGVNVGMSGVFHMGPLNESASEVMVTLQYNHIMFNGFSQNASLYLPTNIDSQPYSLYSTTCSTNFNLSSLSSNILYGFTIFKGFTFLVGEHVELMVQKQLQHQINVFMVNDSTPNFKAPADWQRNGNTLTFTGWPSTISPFALCLTTGCKYNTTSLGLPGTVMLTYVFHITNITSTDAFKQSVYRLGFVYNL